jgi:hypothetical protein
MEVSLNFCGISVSYSAMISGWAKPEFGQLKYTLFSETEGVLFSKKYTFRKPSQ